MAIITAFTGISLCFAMAVLVGILVAAIMANRRSKAKLDAAWVILEAAHPELFSETSTSPRRIDVR